MVTLCSEGPEPCFAVGFPLCSGGHFWAYLGRYRICILPVLLVWSSFILEAAEYLCLIVWDWWCMSVWMRVFASSVCCTYGLETAKLQQGTHWASTNKCSLAVQYKLYRQGEAPAQTIMRKAGQRSKILLFLVFCFFQKWLCATVNMANNSACYFRVLAKGAHICLQLTV